LKKPTPAIKEPRKEQGENLLTLTHSLIKRREFKLGEISLRKRIFEEKMGVFMKKNQSISHMIHGEMKEGLLYDNRHKD
jgi:hypothetical protein